MQTAALFDPGDAAVAFAPMAGMDSIKPENPSSPSMPVDDSIPVVPTLSNDETAASTSNGQERGRLSAYAKLELVDGSYYMNTISIVIGRDIEVGREAKRQAARLQMKATGEPLVPLADDVRSVARSAISESGGLLGCIPRKRKRKSKTGSSGSDHIKDSFQFDQTIIRDGSPDVNMDDLLPDPYEEPLVAIHEPVQEDGSVSVSRGISRRHARIAYSYQTDCFQMTVLGRNGVFLDGEYYGKDRTVDLHHGNEIQISGVFIKFMLPTEAVTHGDDQVSSSHVSHNFEDSEGGNLEAEDMDDFEDLPPEQRFNNSHLYHSYNSDSGEDSEPVLSIEDEAPKAPRVKLKIKQQAAAKQRAAAAEKEVARKLALKQSKAPNGKVGKRTLTKAERRLKRRQEAEARRQRKKGTEASDDADEEDEEQEEVQEEINEPAAVETAKASKKPAKTPAKTTEPPKPTAASPTEASMHLVARENDLINGENGVYVPNLPLGAVIPARKKGPGRPPKDGLMSKREKALINKHLKELERAKKLGLDPSQVAPLDLATSKPAKPRVEGERAPSGSTLPVTSYTTPQAQTGDRSTSADKATQLVKAEEPSQPEMKESDYTAEQLTKPSANYAVMLYDILKEHGRLNLQQIYDVMERKFPYFKFKAGTSGWQSSVRHNLGQNDIFRKAEKDGKGYSWELNPDKQMEPPRKVKKQASPPVHPTQTYGGYPRPYPNQPSYSQQYPQQRPPGAPGAQASHFATGSQQNSASFSGSYTSSYNSTQQQPNNTASRPMNAPLPPGQRREPVWSRDTLIKTVYKIYAPRLGPSVPLQEICEHAVDWFLNPTDMQKAGRKQPEGKELEILKALRDAHAAQETKQEIPANRPPGAGPPVVGAGAANPAASSSVAVPGTQAAANIAATSGPPQGATAQTAPAHASTSTPVPQQQPADASAPGTPQAPKPEPLTRPNSSSGEPRETKSNTPPVEPPAPAAPSDQHAPATTAG